VRVLIAAGQGGKAPGRLHGKKARTGRIGWQRADLCVTGHLGTLAALKRACQRPAAPISLPKSDTPARHRPSAFQAWQTPGHSVFAERGTLLSIACARDRSLRLLSSLLSSVPITEWHRRGVR
jgi:hypothetical protein